MREKRKPIKSGDEKLSNEMGEKVRKMKNMHTKVGLKRIPHQVKWEKKCGKAGPMPLQMGGLINCR